MSLYNVKLSPWASPVIVEAAGKQKAEEMALKYHPKCDCCNADSVVESVTVRLEPVSIHQKVIMQITQEEIFT